MKNRAVFFDRDGVINNNANYYYVYRPVQLELNPDIGEAIEKINQAGLKVLVVSNQGGISKGLYETFDVEMVHAEIQRKLNQYKASVDEFYFCPHHDSIEKCLCRKPDSLLIEKAAAVHNIDLESSFFIGDSQRDIQAGKKVGLHTFKVDANNSVMPVVKQILDLI